MERVDGDEAIKTRRAKKPRGETSTRYRGLETSQLILYVGIPMKYNLQKREEGTSPTLPSDTAVRPTRGPAKMKARRLALAVKSWQIVRLALAILLPESALVNVLSESDRVTERDGKNR